MLITVMLVRQWMNGVENFNKEDNPLKIWLVSNLHVLLHQMELLYTRIDASKFFRSCAPVLVISKVLVSGFDDCLLMNRRIGITAFDTLSTRHKMFTGDDSCCYYYEPEFKHYSWHWKHPQSPKLKKRKYAALGF